MQLFWWEFGSINFHNFLWSNSIYWKLSKNEIFEILGNCFVTCQIFGPFFWENFELKDFARANQWIRSISILSHNFREFWILVTAYINGQGNLMSLFVHNCIYFKTATIKGPKPTCRVQMCQPCQPCEFWGLSKPYVWRDPPDPLSKWFNVTFQGPLPYLCPSPRTIRFVVPGQHHCSTSVLLPSPPQVLYYSPIPSSSNRVLFLLFSNFLITIYNVSVTF